MKKKNKQTFLWTGEMGTAALFQERRRDRGRVEEDVGGVYEKLFLEREVFKKLFLKRGGC